jgi:hypothetical protein
MQKIINNRSLTYSIAVAAQHCAHCAKLTPVVGLILPAGHETLESDADDETRAAVWEVADADAILFFIEYLPESVQKRLQEFSQHYRLDHCEQAQQSYWINHCCFCGRKQGEFELYCEPEGAFVPISEAAAASIRLHHVAESIETRASGYAYAPEFFDSHR